ncbi:MAG: L-aspartate oxidase [Chloroflexi bacterium]|nr:L-aspartate oxidase [Chloroflexota bacterium]
MNLSIFDYIIVGSGIAGLYAALLAREVGSVLLLTKGSIEECNTRYAQGGIAAAIGPDDSPALHAEDTLAAGAGLCDPEAVRILTEEGPDRIADLIRFGVPFDTLHGEVALTREAAHRLPRILHAGGDATGEHIELTLSGLARHRNITILEYSLATRLLGDARNVRGVEVLDCRTNQVTAFEGRAVILATGGCGRLYHISTNPEVATGDGVALAFRAGAEVMDMEFFQFHPTALRLPGVPPFLISEAVRGEGGILRNVAGRRFMFDYAPQGELAPRDVVARSIVAEMAKTGADHVLLDVSHLPATVVAARFPRIYGFCLEHGVDMTTTPIPVAPAAHYMMGGIRTNTWGETTLPGLYAAGECACTGVHGANRLASNSLLETLIFGKRIIQRTLEARDGATPRGAPPTPEAEALPARRGAGDAGVPTLPALQRLMWDQVGITRSGASLAEAAATLAAWEGTLPAPTDRASHELANLLLVARLTAEAALIREESRGAHYRTDFPEPNPAWLRHIVFCRYRD